MYKLELKLDVYRRLELCLSEIHPEIKLILVSCDYALAALGFADQPPCTVHVDMTEPERETLMDELMQYEIDAFNQPDTQILEKTPAYQLYEKYGWMWDIFHSAKYIDTAG